MPPEHPFSYPEPDPGPPYGTPRIFLPGAWPHIPGAFPDSGGAAGKGSPCGPFYISDSLPASGNPCRPDPPGPLPDRRLRTPYIPPGYGEAQTGYLFWRGSWVCIKAAGRSWHGWPHIPGPGPPLGSEPPPHPDTFHPGASRRSHTYAPPGRTGSWSPGTRGRCTDPGPGPFWGCVPWHS